VRLRIVPPGSAAADPEEVEALLEAAGAYRHPHHHGTWFRWFTDPAEICDVMDPLFAAARLGARIEEHPPPPVPAEVAAEDARRGVQRCVDGCVSIDSAKPSPHSPDNAACICIGCAGAVCVACQRRPVEGVMRICEPCAHVEALYQADLVDPFEAIP
jgi:hypothetical protein